MAKNRTNGELAKQRSAQSNRTANDALASGPAAPSGSDQSPKLHSAGAAQAVAGLVGIVVLVYVAARAAILSFTHDESLTVLRGVLPGLESLLSFSFADANNHLLNSFLVYLSSSLFGLSEAALRLPNVLALLLFGTAGWLIVRRLPDPVLQVSAFLLLLLNPFQLDFFALCRGYGLSVGLATASLYFALESTTGSKRKTASTLACSMSLASLAVLANLAVLNFLLSLGAMLCAFRLREKWQQRRRSSVAQLSAEFARETLLPVLSPMVVLAVILTPVVRKLVDNKALYYGGTDGFWADTMTSLAEATLYGQSFAGSGASAMCMLAVATVLTAATATAVRWSREGLSDSVSRRIMLLGILVLCISAIQLQHHLMGTKFLIERTGLFFLPLLGLILAFLCEDLLRLHKAALAVPVTLALLAAANVVATANLTHTHTWRYDADTKTMMADVAALIAAAPQSDRASSIGGLWIFEPTVNFYRTQLGLERLSRMTRAGLKGTYDFYYLPESELAKLGHLNLKVVEQYPTTSYQLAVRPRP